MEVMISAGRTAWGWVGIAASSEGLLGTTLPAVSREKALAPLRHRWPGAQEGMTPLTAALQSKLHRYFDGESADLHSETLDVRNATEFQARVWNVARSIPRGQVRS